MIIAIIRFNQTSSGAQGFPILACVQYRVRNSIDSAPKEVLQGSPIITNE